MNKNIKHIIIGVIVSLSMFSSCNFLDVNPYIKDMLQYDSLFTRKETTEQWLWSTYHTLNHQGSEIAWAILTGFPYSSDEAIYSDVTNLCQQYQNCEYSPDQQLFEDRWQHFYIGIRKASIFIHNVMKCTELSTTERLRMQGEARFLRCYFYWMLMKQYGPVCLIPEEGQDISLSYEELALPRSPFDDCVEYVVKELEEAARILPDERPTPYLGRATSGAALALRAKVLLYAASPLYNGNTDLFNFTDKDGNILISQTADNKKWARAAAAALEVVESGYYSLWTADKSANTAPLASNVPTADFPDGAGSIDPYESYRQAFNGEVPLNRNKELIFIRQKYENSINWIVWHAFPLSHRGFNHIAVTHKQVNAYYMRDGRDISQSSSEFPYVTTGFTDNLTDDPFVPADVHNMYVNREPRFYASISYNNCIWENGSADERLRNFRANYYRGGSDGKQLSRPYDFPLTGVGLKKYYHPDDTWDAESEKYTEKYEPTIRYADVLLWLAEALNEVEGSYEIDRALYEGKITITRDVDLMRSVFSQVRFRAGLPDLSPTEYADKNIFRDKLKRERQVELFMEAARYFDLRRWKDADIEENTPLTGMNIDIKAGDNRERFYKETPIMMSKVFMPKMYFWPIATHELKRNSKLSQSPGW